MVTIMKNNGTVDKFIVGAMMAFCNALNIVGWGKSISSQK